jgi:succinyl-CoA synthetase alpha subunit
MSLDLRITAETPVIVQGIGHSSSRRWVDSMRRYGTRIAGWVAPEPAGADAGALPVFPTVAAAQAATGAEVCVSMVEPRIAADAILEAADAGIRLIVSLTRDMPLHDAVRVRRRLRDLGTAVVGPDSSGLALPGARVKLGSIPDDALAPGVIALVSASASLAAEAGCRLVQAGLGQSLYIDVGSHVIKGVGMADLPALLQADAATEAVVFLGTTRGTGEEDFAAAARLAGLAKPVFVYTAGGRLRPAADFRKSVSDGALGGFWPPAGCRGGPAPLTAAAKEEALAAAGAQVYNSLGALITAVQAAV